MTVVPSLPPESSNFDYYLEFLKALRLDNYKFAGKLWDNKRGTSLELYTAGAGWYYSFCKSVDMFDMLLSRIPYNNKYQEYINSAIVLRELKARGMLDLSLSLFIGCPSDFIEDIIHDFDPNENFGSGRTPLFYTQDADGVRILVSHGADPNVIDNTGISPLMNAFIQYKNNNELFKNSSSSSRDNIVYEKFVRSDISIIKALIHCGAKDDSFFNLYNEYNPYDSLGLN